MKTDLRAANPYRFIALGVVLVHISIIAFGNIGGGLRMLGYAPGFASIFGGAITMLIFVRLRDLTTYRMWILASAIEIAVGAMAFAETSTQSLLNVALVTGLLFVLSVLKISIGRRFSGRRASASLISSGLITFACSLVYATCRATHIPIETDAILATDLSVTGLALMFFGTDLRRENRSK